MKQHKISYYIEDRKTIAYCTICSAEGAALFCDCPGEFISPPTQPKDNDIVDKKVDKLEEHF